MIKKLFILAIILLAVNYFYGEKIENWWQNSWFGFLAGNSPIAGDEVTESDNDTVVYSEAELSVIAEKLPKDIQLQIDNWLLSQNLDKYGNPISRADIDSATTIAGGSERFVEIFQKFPELLGKFKISLEGFKQNLEAIEQEHRPVN
ncbi:MAG: hypothetical protein NUV82_04545 [Candidatus Komeilibacteria bacterium]|nr:hypothetical protein [Candidatus Komeilibacteria bacterium]